MSAAYLAFDASFDGITIPDIIDIRDQDTVADVTHARGASAVATQAIFKDGLGARVTIVTSDLAIRRSINPGSGVGALVTTRARRADGTGLTMGANETATYPHATCVAATATGAHRGVATLELVFEAYDPTGTGVVAFS